MLTIENLHAGYKPQEEILKGLTLSMETGRIHGLVGLNGAGKTTLLNTLYQFIRSFEGQISYNDAPLRRIDIAYLETDNYFYPYMTGKEYLELFPAGAEGFDSDNWQQLFALPLNDITENYSNGMRKKLALLAVLKPDKPILVLDEPFNGLDLESVHLLLLILARLRDKGKTILITSHIYESLSGCCDAIHHLVNGQIAHSYPRTEFPILHQELQAGVEQRSAPLLNELLHS